MKMSLHQEMGIAVGVNWKILTSNKKKKRLVKHKPRWRCCEMQSVVVSLDMKIGRCSDAKARDVLESN